MVLHLLPVPAPADAEQEPAAREEIERGDLLGRRDRVALDHEADTGPEQQPLRRHGGGGEGQERIEGLPVLGGQVRAAGPGAAAAGRDVGVLGHEQRLEAPLLGRPGELRRADRVPGREDRDSKVHGLSSWAPPAPPPGLRRAPP